MKISLFDTFIFLNVNSNIDFGGSEKKVDHLIEFGSRKFDQNCPFPQKYRAQKSEKNIF